MCVLFAELCPCRTVLLHRTRSTACCLWSVVKRPLLFTNTMSTCLEVRETLRPLVAWPLSTIHSSSIWPPTVSIWATVSMNLRTLKCRRRNSKTGRRDAYLMVSDIYIINTPTHPPPTENDFLVVVQSKVPIWVAKQKRKIVISFSAGNESFGLF